jgi:hypothetical protein
VNKSLFAKLFRGAKRTAGRSYSCAAVPHPRLAIKEESSFSEPYRVLASCLAHLGRLDDAREIVERLRVFTPLVMPPRIPQRNEAHRAVDFAGLRLAMGEAT